MSAQLAQRSPEWFTARLGSLGASQIADALAKTRSGWGASRDNIMAQLICERLTGQPYETYTNAAMQRGIETEPFAVNAYEVHTGNVTERCGLFRHPTIDGTHASPDRLVANDGLLEVKCPNTATHVQTLLSQTIEGKYIKQMQWQMACTRRLWCDFASFDDRMPPHLRLWVKRVERDSAAILHMETEAREFIKELEDRMAKLQALAL